MCVSNLALIICLRDIFFKGKQQVNLASDFQCLLIELMSISPFRGLCLRVLS